MKPPRRQQRGERSDFSREEKLVAENKKLKRELKSLRNLIKRSDLSRLEHLERVVNEQREFDKEIKKQDSKRKDKWACHSCGRGHMIPRVFTRRDGDFYYRTCNNEDCGNRTKMKKLNKDVDLSMLEPSKE